jgi:hypothetical protein
MFRFLNRLQLWLRVATMVIDMIIGPPPHLEGI